MFSYEIFNLNLKLSIANFLYLGAGFLLATKSGGPVAMASLDPPL